MKKLVYLSIIICCSFSVFAQQDGLRAGVHSGIPLSDAKDFSSVNLGLDVSYHFHINNKVSIGASTGYSTFIGKDSFDDYSFIPIAFSGRVAHIYSFYYGGDVGYAIATNKDTEGGLYYQTKIGWSRKTVDFYGFYKSVDEDGKTLSSIGLGFAHRFKFKKHKK